MKILIVEDDQAKRLTLTADLKEVGHTVSAVPTAPEALDMLEREGVDVVITDLKLPGMDGLELLRAIKEGISPPTEVIMMTAYGSIPLAVEAIRKGALDFITKPFDNRQMIPLLERIEKKMACKDPAREIRPVKEYLEIEHAIVGVSPPMRRLKRLVRACAESDANVLLCGETGSGKDLIASVIHKHSKRHSFPLVKVSCAVFPEQLIESELFGHEKGAFTGADQRKNGRFELAEHGSLYLDDVDDIPLQEQVKLLRVIDEKTFERVGSSTPIHCDVRIISSTKVDLSERIEQGSFREDLYYRLKVLEIDVPPLRERVEDIPSLAVHIVERLTGRKQVSISEEVADCLQEYHWPGNVRELSHMLEQALITGQGVLSSKQLNIPGGSVSAGQRGGNFKKTIERAERELLEQALKKADGNKTAAAESLGMKPSTFRDKLRKYELD